MTWVKEPPHVPEEGEPSIYYWYYDIKDDVVWPAEIYYGCWKLYALDGWWWDEPIKPPIKPMIEENPKRKVKRNANK